jgi:hypothetical protein
MSGQRDICRAPVSVRSFHDPQAGQRHRCGAGRIAHIVQAVIMRSRSCAIICGFAPDSAERTSPKSGIGSNEPLSAYLAARFPVAVATNSNSTVMCRDRSDKVAEVGPTCR